MNQSGIVLLAKKPGITSFSSLNVIKKSLGTKKVGHTGTLDSFAQGLLVVCTGSLTRLAGQITAFDKTYEAVIEFGTQTDTLDPTGVVIKNAPLPTLDAVKESLKKFTGKIMQRPPEFSAIKIDGKRASDLQRAGKVAEIPAREITVYSSYLNEIAFENGEIIDSSVLTSGGSMPNSLANLKVKYARVTFNVSKGTYIRSLARDIGEDCGSAAHLVGLLRTSVGMFKLQDAAFAGELAPFTIAGVHETQTFGQFSTFNSQFSIEKAAAKIVSKMQAMSPDLARACGLEPLTLCAQYENDFYNGRPLRQKMFAEIPKQVRNDGGGSMPNGLANNKCIETKTSPFNFSLQLVAKFAVFQESGAFCGVISAQNGKFKYEFVCPKE